MIARRIVTGLLATALLSLPGSAQKAQGGEHGAMGFRPQANANKSGKPDRKAGDWLRKHKDLPPDQQLKALESDPNFKKLPPARQAELRERLQKFASLTPEQREKALKRMEFMASLTPAQRQQVRQANQQLEALPQDRRIMVHKALRHLRQMDPQQREQLLQSERFRSTFSDQEQTILKQLSAINPPEAAGPGKGASSAPSNMTPAPPAK